MILPLLIHSNQEKHTVAIFLTLCSFCLYYKKNQAFQASGIHFLLILLVLLISCLHHHPPSDLMKTLFNFSSAFYIVIVISLCTNIPCHLICIIYLCDLGMVPHGLITSHVFRCVIPAATTVFKWTISQTQISLILFFRMSARKLVCVFLLCQLLNNYSECAAIWTKLERLKRQDYFPNWGVQIPASDDKISPLSLVPYKIHDRYDQLSPWKRKQLEEAEANGLSKLYEEEIAWMMYEHLLKTRDRPRTAPMLIGWEEPQHQLQRQRNTHFGITHLKMELNAVDVDKNLEDQHLIEWNINAIQCPSTFCCAFVFVNRIVKLVLLQFIAIHIFSCEISFLFVSKIKGSFSDITQTFVCSKSFQKQWCKWGKSHPEASHWFPDHVNLYSLLLQHRIVLELRNNVKANKIIQRKWVKQKQHC